MGEVREKSYHFQWFQLTDFPTKNIKLGTFTILWRWQQTISSFLPSITLKNIKLFFNEVWWNSNNFPTTIRSRNQICPRKMKTCVHTETVHTLDVLPWWMVKRSVVHLYHGILVSNIKEPTTDTHNLVNLQKMMTSEKSQSWRVTGCMTTFTLHSWNVEFTERDNRFVTARD